MRGSFISCLPATRGGRPAREASPPGGDVRLGSAVQRKLLPCLRGRAPPHSWGDPPRLCGSKEITSPLAGKSASPRSGEVGARSAPGGEVRPCSAVQRKLLPRLRGRSASPLVGRSARSAGWGSPPLLCGSKEITSQPAGKKRLPTRGEVGAQRRVGKSAPALRFKRSSW